MTDEAVLSVRGEARQLVEPDFALLHCNLHAVAQSKPAVLDVLGAQQNATTAALAALGGVARSVATDRARLTWSTRSVTSYPEHSPEGKLPTGRFVGEAGLLVGVRDAGLHDRVILALAATAELTVNHVSWHVDPDNPAWADVRAAAIAAAIEKGHDYAAALRGTLLRVEQVADTGLLGGSEPPSRMRAYAAGASRGSSESFGPGVPSLDPEPQEVSAVIEARLIATIAPLAPRSS